MRKLIDFIKLAGFRGGHWIFLRRQFDSHRVFSILIKFARAYRRIILRRPRVGAVVGSLGKTTTTRFVRAALGGPVRQPLYSNYGSSLACNMLAVRPWDKHAVLEAGIAAPGMMDANRYILKPDFVVVTSIAWEHFRSFKSQEDIRAEKVKIVAGLPAEGWAILNGDDPNVRWMATQTQAQVIYYGFGEDCDVRLVEHQFNWPQGMSGRVTKGDHSWAVETRLFGKHFWYPLLAGLATAVTFETDIQGAIDRMASLAPTPKRFDYMHLEDDVTVIDDSCKGGIDSWMTALDSLEQVQAKRKIVVFGDIEDPPGARSEVYRAVGERMGQVADIAILYGFGADLLKARSSARKAGIRPEDTHILKSDVPGIVSTLRGMMQPGDVILIKGRAAYRLERVALALQDRAVSCPLKMCSVKVPTCDVCPMLEKNSHDFQNHYILPYIKS